MSRARRIAVVVVLCGVTALAAGCAAGPTEPVETPQQFIDRETLPSCGELELAQGDEIPGENLECLEGAGEDGAELAVTRPTAEGDPVTEYYRVLPGGGWEAYIDGSQDRNGGVWWYTECPEAADIEDLATCEGAVL